MIWALAAAAVAHCVPCLFVEDDAEEEYKGTLGWTDQKKRHSEWFSQAGDQHVFKGAVLKSVRNLPPLTTKAKFTSNFQTTQNSELKQNFEEAATRDRQFILESAFRDQNSFGQ